jgi:quinol monooxygenase YgiN
MRKVEANGEIVSTAKITVSSEHRRELCQTISDLLKLIRNEAGCLSYRFYEEQGDECSFLLIGAWETREAWDHHLNSDNFAVLLGSLKLLCDLPCVDFKLLAHVKSIEAITRVRCEPFKEAVPIFIT